MKSLTSIFALALAFAGISATAQEPIVASAADSKPQLQRKKVDGVIATVGD